MKALLICLSIFVVDGDTIRLGAERVRLAGLDCPELREPGGHRAKKALQSLISGRTVTLERVGRDRFNRTVARVFVGGRDVACELIRSGHCRRFVKYDPAGVYTACEARP